MSSDLPSDPSRRGALKCLAFGGVGTVFVLAGGILTPVELALAASTKDSSAVSGVPLFLQISDTHIGFNKEANPDVAGTLKQTIDFVNAMPVKPALTIHTGAVRSSGPVVVRSEYHRAAYGTGRARCDRRPRR
jgi:hypothetical protein